MNEMQTVLNLFDTYLFEKNLNFEGIIIGGAALNIMNITNRVTRDIDFLDPKIPLAIKDASINFIKSNPSLQLNAEEWFNNGPNALIRDLPQNWKNGLVEIYKGKAIQLKTLSRIDLLKTKLYAYCDRDIDLDDCIALKPSSEDIDDCREWVLKGDGNPHWPERVDEQFLRLKKELGYD
ncbi:MAG: hypothetical protein COA79_04465 [Planctomycetota bacterium]|nr:MAG: hypothetical protein COA79_04465 [Planctomycetota bacterium]